jgi:hypothetical protein
VVAREDEMSEHRRLYWNQREVRGEIQQSRTHLFPMDRQTALCGLPLPIGDQGYDVMWDDTENPEHLCRRCMARMRKAG